MDDARTLYPNTPGMVDDRPAGPAALLGGGPPASRFYPNTPGMIDDLPPPVPRRPEGPPAPVLASKFYPNTPGMTDGPSAAPAPVDPAAVAAYDFELPSNFEVDPPMMARFKTTAVRHGLDPAAASELLALHAELTAAPAPWQGSENWGAEASALPELREGGDGQEAITAAMALADDAVLDFLDESRLGDHPQLVRWAVRVGRELRRLRGGRG